VIRDDRRREEARELETAVAVWRAHHGNLDALTGKSGDTSRPFSFDRGPPFEVKAELLKEINRRSEVTDDDSYVIQPFERHPSNLHDVAWMQQRTPCYAEARAAQSVPIETLLLIAAFKPQKALETAKRKRCKLLCRKVAMSEHFFGLTSMPQHVKS
jgi:hypothetical protein